MPITAITTSATFQLKASAAGYIQCIFCANAGTTWTIKILDGPDPNGNTTTLIGGTSPLTLTVGDILDTPLYFSKGLQVVTSGTAGEVEIQWS